jgi:hypothetical protein
VQQLKNIPADTVVYVTEGVNAVAKKYGSPKPE